MKFTQTRPQITGYYWYIDIAYQVPCIGFIGPMNKFYDSRWQEHNADSIAAQKHFRFGDKIEIPAVELT